MFASKLEGGRIAKKDIFLVHCGAIPYLTFAQN